MDQESQQLTEFDLFTCNPYLQLLKAYLPYLSPDIQESIAIFIRISELLSTMDFYRHKPVPLYRDNKDMQHIINDIGKYWPQKDKELLNIISNMDNITDFYKMYQSMNAEASDGSSSQADILKSFLSPQQQEMYESYKNLLNM